MNIQLQQITIRELAEGFIDDAEGGVRGYGGRLNIRPAYQREFVYKDKQRDAVINTVRKGFPLNVLYWAVNEDGSFEVLDGQQRSISICQYVDNQFSINGLSFNNLTDDQQAQILDYPLMVYFCEGLPSEKLDWFKTINIAGEKLFEQELRNAIYTGPWLTEAKKYFSKTNCPAYAIGHKLLNGSPIRQDYLETALEWINGGDVVGYMSAHQHDPNANELWLYFKSVIDWANVLFPNYRKEMKGVAWGLLYNAHKADALDAKKLEAEVARLMQDEDVTRKAGIYEYVLSGNERALSLRAFSDKQKREAYERQQGICPKCGKEFDISEMEADHIDPWHSGGQTIAANCQMLCKADNRRKSGV